MAREKYGDDVVDKVKAEMWMHVQQTRYLQRYVQAVNNNYAEGFKISPNKSSFNSIEKFY